MSYVKPDLVISPKSKISDLKVLYDKGEGEWSLAEMKWEGGDAVGIRWNGSSNDPNQSGTGNPQSRGVPTWFVLPDEIADVVTKWVTKQNKE